MDCTYMEMLDLTVGLCNNADMAKGINIAKAIVEDSGYIPYEDWSAMTDGEQVKEIKGYLGYEEDES